MISHVARRNRGGVYKLKSFFEDQPNLLIWCAGCCGSRSQIWLYYCFTGVTEVTRNCGKYKGAFQAGDNECKDFQLMNHASAKLCNCKKDGCNLQSFNIPKTVTPVPSVPPKTQPTTKPSDVHHVPAITSPEVTTQKPNSGSVNGIWNSFAVVLLFLMGQVIALAV